MKRRAFIKQAALGSVLAPIGNHLQDLATVLNPLTPMKSLQISLAQWSLHRSYEKGLLNPHEFAATAKQVYDIQAIEYVAGFYLDQANDEVFWNTMKARAENEGVTSLLIMVDEQGDFGVTSKAKRKEAVENHYKWVEAAKLLGCHSIRVNAFGDEHVDRFKAAMVDSMNMLCSYAAKENINVIIENHGLFSSNAKVITDIVKAVNLPNFGTFPDFGNWCTSAKWGSTQFDCDTQYNRYQGVAEFLPFAKAVSAKSYNFDAAGQDTTIDYAKMMSIVKESNYDGFIGIEYEGNILNEHEGILATKALMEKSWNA